MSERTYSYQPESTKEGHLPPWEVAKAYAFHVVLKVVSEKLEVAIADMLEQREDDFIASQLELKGGGCPTSRAVRKCLRKCNEKDWYPGKPVKYSGGRPSTITEKQKDAVAQTAMELKRSRIAPTPRNVRAKLARRAFNPDTKQPMSDWSIHQIFSTRCYDESEDDPWIYLRSPAQDVLSTEAKPRRVSMAKWILENYFERSWHDTIAIDPCYSLQALALSKQEELQVAAMGASKWMSKNSARKGVNPRAPAHARTQTSNLTEKVYWTPIFVRGKVKIWGVDSTKAEADPAHYPSKLNDSETWLNIT